MAEITNKQRVHTGLIRKQKSPYALQYLEFERRLESNQNKCRLPTLGMRARKHSMCERMNGEEYLALAKQLKENKQPLKFCEDKENDAEQEEMRQNLIQMKNMLGQVKERYIYTQSSQKNKVMSLQYSQQITPHQGAELPLQQINCHRSRALSNALNPLKELSDENMQAPLKFLEYKKGRRELPLWMKLD